MLTIEQIIIRLLLSIVLSGIIGLERESIRRPAGFRTHILVCVGATLVMLVGIYIFDYYKYETSIDPTRLGAQVISGIGFLGAGTIIRNGSSVKGLTTAASLWAVACIGIAIGSGFYLGGILTGAFVFITLLIFTGVERHIKNRSNYMAIRIVSQNKPGQLGKVGQVTGNMGVIIENISLDSEDDKLVTINLLTKLPSASVKLELLEKISKLEGILEISQRT